MNLMMNSMKMNLMMMRMSSSTTDNSFIVWDDFDEDIFFTDRHAELDIDLQKNAIQLAATGIDLDYIVTRESSSCFWNSLTNKLKKEETNTERNIAKIFTKCF